MSLLTTDALRNRLLFDLRCLRRRRAAEIPGDVIDSYVAHRWLAWNHGSLRLTETGTAVAEALERVTLDAPDSTLPAVPDTRT